MERSNKRKLDDDSIEEVGVNQRKKVKNDEDPREAKIEEFIEFIKSKNPNELLKKYRETNWPIGNKLTAYSGSILAQHLNINEDKVIEFASNLDPKKSFVKFYRDILRNITKENNKNYFLEKNRGKKKLNKIEKQREEDKRQKIEEFKKLIRSKDLFKLWMKNNTTHWRDNEQHIKTNIMNHLNMNAGALDKYVNYIEDDDYISFGKFYCDFLTEIFSDKLEEFELRENEILGNQEKVKRLKFEEFHNLVEKQNLHELRKKYMGTGWIIEGGRSKINIKTDIMYHLNIDANTLGEYVKYITDGNYIRFGKFYRKLLTEIFSNKLEEYNLQEKRLKYEEFNRLVNTQNLHELWKKYTATKWIIGGYRSKHNIETNIMDQLNIDTNTLNKYVHYITDGDYISFGKFYCDLLTEIMPNIEKPIIDIPEKKRVEKKFYTYNFDNFNFVRENIGKEQLYQPPMPIEANNFGSQNLTIEQPKEIEPVGENIIGANHIIQNLAIEELLLLQPNEIENTLINLDDISYDVTYDDILDLAYLPID